MTVPLPPVSYDPDEAYAHTLLFHTDFTSRCRYDAPPRRWHFRGTDGRWLPTDFGRVVGIAKALLTEAATRDLPPLTLRCAFHPNPESVEPLGTLDDIRALHAATTAAARADFERRQAAHLAAVKTQGARLDELTAARVRYREAIAAVPVGQTLNGQQSRGLVPVDDRAIREAEEHLDRLVREAPTPPPSRPFAPQHYVFTPDQRRALRAYLNRRNIESVVKTVSNEDAVRYFPSLHAAPVGDPMTFLRERIRLAPGAAVVTSEVWTAYLDALPADVAPLVGRTTFHAMVQDTFGVTPEKSNGRKLYRGIRLLPAPDEAAGPAPANFVPLRAVGAS